MKIQNITVVFLVIAIPIIMVLSYYLHMQQQTLRVQIEYDTKLSQSTKEAVKSYETNIFARDDVKERDVIQASVNTFLTSLSNTLNISGTAKEYMSNYIPAIIAGLYDGYYMFSQVGEPITIKSASGLQLYYNTDSGEIVETRDDFCQVIYVPAEGETAKTAKYNGKNIYFVTDAQKAKNSYKPVLGAKNLYTARYTKFNDTNVVVKYTLDNRIYVHGKVGGKAVNYYGYLEYFDDKVKLPRIDENKLEAVKNGIKQEIGYNGINIEAETLEEQLIFEDDFGDCYINTFKYIYDCNNEKLYYDEAEDNFFTYNLLDGTAEYIDDDQEIKAGDSRCRYKALSVLWGTNTTTAYKKIYQALNGSDKGRWFVDAHGFTKTGMCEANVDDITNRVSPNLIADLGISPDILANYSDINYYVEAYTFTNWVKQNLKDVKQQVYNKEINEYETIIIDNIFDINESNNPEDDESIFVKHKKKIQKEIIRNDLNLAIYNYSRGTKSFNLPVPSENAMDTMVSNISFMAFLQGIPCGLKTYNNYFLATSLESKLFVVPSQLFYVSDNLDFHRIYCKECTNTRYTAYRSNEFQVRQVETFDGVLYYYPHDKQDKIDTEDNNKVIPNNYSETACYYCIINKANYTRTEDDKVKGQMTKAYTEGLARERYEQKATAIRTIDEDQEPSNIPTPTPAPTPAPTPVSQNPTQPTPTPQNQDTSEYVTLTYVSDPHFYPDEQMRGGEPVPWTYFVSKIKNYTNVFNGRLTKDVSTPKVSVPKGTVITITSDEPVISTDEVGATITFEKMWVTEDNSTLRAKNKLFMNEDKKIYAYYRFMRGDTLVWDKPVIYLYPTEETEINVKVRYPDRLTVSYPKYQANGWRVIAKPDGTLKDLETNRELYCLYYEARNNEDPDIYKNGFIVKGEESAKFLEEKLAILGLNEREAEEFIVYWLPKLEANKYNYIRFAEEEYINENMPLDIEPEPQTTIRVLMEFKGLEEPIDMEEQVLKPVTRKGYTVVEWGGTEL